MGSRSCLPDCRAVQAFRFRTRSCREESHPWRASRQSADITLPSSVAVVTQALPSITAGVDQALPWIAVFQAIFSPLSSLQLTGSFHSAGTWPFCVGPRNSGHPSTSARADNWLPMASPKQRMTRRGLLMRGSITPDTCLVANKRGGHSAPSLKMSTSRRACRLRFVDVSGCAATQLDWFVSSPGLKVEDEDDVADQHEQREHDDLSQGALFRFFGDRVDLGGLSFRQFGNFCCIDSRILS